MGIVSTPVDNTLTTGPPDIVPNKLDDRIAAWAGPPRIFLVKLKASLMREVPPPVTAKIDPNTMKGITILSNIDGNLPSKE
jgi:hypothetical protein